MTARSSQLIRGCPLPTHEAERLLVAATGASRAEVVVGFDVAADRIAIFEAFVARRMNGEPLQYIEGTVPFGPVTVVVDPRVLIPRPETEQLFEIARDLIDEPRVIVDLCTGSGNLATALSAVFPDAEVFATDASPDAVDVARRNAEDNGVQVEVLHGDLFHPLPPHVRGRADLVVANPPYLSDAEYGDVPPDVRREPKSALVGGRRGDEVVRRIAEGLPIWLRPGGAFAIEISEFAPADTMGHFERLDVELQEDLFHKPRFAIGRRRIE